MPPFSHLSIFDRLIDCKDTLIKLSSGFTYEIQISTILSIAERSVHVNKVG
jgi:hypothetical protein